MECHPLKIVYVTPALYMAGGVERVLSLKANYFADTFGYDITIILTEGKDKPLFYELSPNIKVINLDINFEELWKCSFARKVIVYLFKQFHYRKLLQAELMRLHPDITVSLLRREINFINDINDGSCKIGELHINRDNYRNFKTEQAGLLKRLFAKAWSQDLVKHLRRLHRLVVLTDKDREDWTELHNVVTIPNPLADGLGAKSLLTEKRIVAIARYSHEKGIDLLLKAWADSDIQKSDWRLDVYGDGERAPYEQLMDELHIDRRRCQLHGRTSHVEEEYCKSSLVVVSSRFEGFGMVIIEAMACGLPVVAFDCPWGPRSIIHDGQDGLLAENGNPGELAAKLKTLMTDDNLRLEMSGNAFRNVQRFRIEKIAEQWRQLFEDVLKDK